MNLLLSPNAKAYPISQKEMAPMQASIMFLIRIFFVFFILTLPTSTRANPACKSPCFTYSLTVKHPISELPILDQRSLRSPCFGVLRKVIGNTFVYQKFHVFFQAFTFQLPSIIYVSFGKNFINNKKHFTKCYWLSRKV